MGEGMMGRHGIACTVLRMKDTEFFEVATRSDEEVLTLSLAHPALFEELVRRYQTPFLRKAESILRNRNDAEDVVQDTFTRIYIAGARFKTVPGASFRSWAYRILVNTAITRYQKNKRVRDGFAELEPETYEMLPDHGQLREREERELSDYIVSAFARIPDILERSLRMHFLEGKTQEEIAHKEGVSVGAIKTRVHRAKKAFRDASKHI